MHAEYDGDWEGLGDQVDTCGYEKQMENLKEGAAIVWSQRAELLVINAFKRLQVR